jgi:hypothetical protein
MSNPTFGCLVEGDDKLFTIDCPLTTPIVVLKKLIREERKNGLLRNIDATDLTLWKVRVTMDSDSTTNSLLQVDLELPSRGEWKGLTGKSVPGTVKMEDNFDHISLYWPATTPLTLEQLHIIVEIPLGERCVH